MPRGIKGSGAARAPAARHCTAWAPGPGPKRKSVYVPKAYSGPGPKRKKEPKNKGQGDYWQFYDQRRNEGMTHKQALKAASKDNERFKLAQAMKRAVNVPLPM